MVRLAAKLPLSKPSPSKSLLTHTEVTRQSGERDTSRNSGEGERWGISGDRRMVEEERETCREIRAEMYREKMRESGEKDSSGCKRR